MFIFLIFRFMEAYREGATGNNVLAKTKAIKKRHRVPLVVDQEPRVGYDRNRGRRALDEHRESESESREERSDSEAAGEIVFSQEEFAFKMRNYIDRPQDHKSPMRRLLENIGSYTRVKGREAPRMDYLDVQLHFDEIVEDNRKCEALDEEWRGVTHVTFNTDEEWRREWSKGGEDESVG